MSKWYLEYPICHRGAHWFDGIDENSWESFHKAIELNLPFEIDVHLSKDGEVFIHHDVSFQRLGGQNLNLTNRTKDELAKLRTFNSKFGVVLLKDLLALLKGQVPLVIEIKHTRKDFALEKELLEVLKNYRGEYALQTFHPFSLQYLRENNVRYPLGLLGGPLTDEKLAYPLKVFVKSLCMAPKLKPDYIGYQWDYLSKRAPQRMRNDYGIPLIAWTVKSESALWVSKKFGDNCIFEDLLI